MFVLNPALSVCASLVYSTLTTLAHGGDSGGRAQLLPYKWALMSMLFSEHKLTKMRCTSVHI